MELRNEGFSIYKDSSVFEDLVRDRHNYRFVHRLCQENKELMKYQGLPHFKYDNMLKENEIAPIVYRVIVAMAYKDVVEMINSLKACLSIDERTLKFVDLHNTTREPWKTQSITRKEFSVLEKRVNFT